MRFVLVIETGNSRIKKNAVYDEFKAFSRKWQVEELLKMLGNMATIYCRIALGKEDDPQLAAAFHDIRELRADVCYPLLAAGGG